ncbi:c-type cytochrome [Verrucomicrobiales bacterium]|nr:c-type cytochrome [Verrucomicrobiales bacterium]
MIEPAIIKSALRLVLFLFAVLGVSCGEPQSKITMEEAEEIVFSNDVYGQICANCHGGSGEGKGELFSPSIGGLPTWYVKDQLKQFRDSHRGIDPGDIPGQQMRAISLSLTDEQIEEASQLVAAMTPIPTEAPGTEVDIEAGRYFFANQCMECHRYNGKGEVVFHSAPLITLNRSYLLRQLHNYRSGIRGAVGDDIYGNKMVEMTKRLTDEEIKLAVDYIGALAHGDDPRSARER